MIVVFLSVHTLSALHCQSPCLHLFYAHICLQKFPFVRTDCSCSVFRFDLYSNYAKLETGRGTGFFIIKLSNTFIFNRDINKFFIIINRLTICLWLQFSLIFLWKLMDRVVNSTKSYGAYQSGMPSYSFWVLIWMIYRDTSVVLSHS